MIIINKLRLKYVIFCEFTLENIIESFLIKYLFTKADIFTYIFTN